jgi:hypothetical protein
MICRKAIYAIKKSKINKKNLLVNGKYLWYINNIKREAKAAYPQTVKLMLYALAVTMLVVAAIFFFP